MREKIIIQKLNDLTNKINEICTKLNKDFLPICEISEIEKQWLDYRYKILELKFCGQLSNELEKEIKRLFYENYEFKKKMGKI